MLNVHMGLGIKDCIPSAEKAKDNDPDVNRTRNLPIWSRMLYH